MYSACSDYGCGINNASSVYTLSQTHMYSRNPLTELYSIGNYFP